MLEYLQITSMTLLKGSWAKKVNKAFKRDFKCRCKYMIVKIFSLTRFRGGNNWGDSRIKCVNVIHVTQFVYFIHCDILLDCV